MCVFTCGCNRADGRLLGPVVVSVAVRDLWPTGRVHGKREQCCPDGKALDKKSA